MTSITLDLFSGKDRPVTSISVPVMSLRDYHDKLSCFAKKRTDRKASIGSQHNIVCREIFQKAQKEIFFLPCCRGTNVSLKKVLSGKLFFLRGIYGWNFILIFTPEDNSKGILCLKQTSRFAQEETYPEGASSASLFSFSARCASILVSEYGCIAEDTAGSLFLQGITVSLLQTPMNKGRSVFLQRRDIFASPKPPLREEDLSSLEPRTCKFIKISCFCRQKDFSYSTYFPVLTPEEVQEKLRNNREKRLEKYGASSFRYRVSDTNQKVTKEERSKPLLVILPPVMKVDVPFGPSREGELFFSYSDQFSLTFQLIFFPHLFEVNQTIPRKKRPCVDNWHIENNVPLVKHCDVTSATMFSFQGMKLVPSSASEASEYKINGMTAEVVSAPGGNCWGIFFIPEKKIHFSADSPERHLPSGSPTPGSSGLGYSKPAASVSQLTATVFSSPERQGKQTQKRRRSPIPGPSEIGRRKPTVSLAQPISTVFVSLERGNQHTQQRGIRSHFSEPFGVRHEPLPFCGGRSSIIPHAQAAATVFVPPDRQGQQTQQRSSRAVSGPSGVRHQVIRPIPIFSQAASSAFVPFEQTQHTQQRRSSPVPVPSEVSYYPYPRPWPFSGEFYSYGSSLPPYPNPFATQDQWMPVFPPPSSVIKPPVAALELLRYDIPVQEGDGHFERAEKASAAVPVGAVQQTSIWRPYEASSSAEFFPQAQIDEESFSAENFDEGAEAPSQAQAENFDEDTDIDVEN